MKSVAQVFIWCALVLLGIHSDLVGIHTDHGDLDWTSKVVVIVAQMISGGLDLILSQTCRVVKGLVENWLGSCNSGLMWDQEEVKLRISL